MKILSTIALMFILQGCSMMEIVYTDEEWAMKTSGTKGDPFYIDKKISEGKIESISYPDMVYKDGKFYLREDFKDIRSDEKENYLENQKLLNGEQE